tara:strand:- start:121 stop:480 length:360 start_codon:yes stop_codon:yes gene_type:complete
MTELDLSDISIYDPAPGYCTVQADEQAKETKSGIIIPQNAVRRQLAGTIVKIGLPVRDPETGYEYKMETSSGRVIKEGDRVIWVRHGGIGIEAPDGGEVLSYFLRFAEVIGYVECAPSQ